MNDEEEIGAHALEGGEARGVARGVEVVDDGADFGGGLEPVAERGAVDDLALELLPVERRERAQPAVDGDVSRRHNVVHAIPEFGWNLKQLACN